MTDAPDIIDSWQAVKRKHKKLKITELQRYSHFYCWPVYSGDLFLETEERRKKKRRAKLK